MPSRRYLNYAALEEIGMVGRDELGGVTMKGILLNTEPDSPLGRRLQLAFPEFYTTEAPKSDAPFNWVQLVAECNRAARASVGNMFPNELSSNGILEKYGIPSLLFATTEDKAEEQSLTLLDSGIADHATFGATVIYEGKPWVVVQREDEEVTIAPAHFFIMPKKK